MPELSLAVAGMLLGAVIVGVLLGWLMRGKLASAEKLAMNAGWQHQVDAQQTEHDRIATQNANLMEQISQFQASGKDLRKRANDLAMQLKIELGKHDDTGRKLKELGNDLSIAVAQRDKLRRQLETAAVRQDAVHSALQKKDEKLARLKLELAKWQQRVPPLVERYRLLKLEAEELELELARAGDELACASDRLIELESTAGSTETRVEPMDNAPLTNLNASNDQYDDTCELATPPHTTIGTPPVDDLKRIKGVGPVIEKTLNALGFLRFSQIATMNEYDIDRVAAELRGFKSRIRREDWIGQARILQYENQRNPA